MDIIYQCMSIADFNVFAEILNLQAMDWFGNILVAEFENATHAYELVNGTLCHIEGMAHVAVNPQQEYGVNFEQIERAVEIYNERFGVE